MSKRLPNPPGSEQSKKCFHCGLRNFPAKTRCARCGYDVWVPLAGPKNNVHAFDHLREFGRLKTGVMIFSAVVLLGLTFLYLKQDSEETPGTVSEPAVAQPATQQTELPEQVIARDDIKSQEAAKQVLAGVKLFQRATEHTMSYEEYDEKLIQLKADLNKTLPSFVSHNPGDEIFRQEIDAAVRDYTAAGSWWKTAERNSAVLTDADRNERLIAKWTSAKTHLDNAAQALVR